MKFITVKSKQTTASVDLVPPLVLGDKQRISLVDIRIPEQYFEFTDCLSPHHLAALVLFVEF